MGLRISDFFLLWVKQVWQKFLFLKSGILLWEIQVNNWYVGNVLKVLTFLQRQMKACLPDEWSKS